MEKNARERMNCAAQHTKKTFAKNSKADVFLFNFILCSISFLFSDAFVFASFSYCFPHFFCSFLADALCVVEHYFSSFLRLAHCLDTTSLMFFHLRVHTFVFIRFVSFRFQFLLDWFSRHNGDRKYSIRARKNNVKYKNLQTIEDSQYYHRRK